jgi:hypothetical protein
LIPGEPVLAGGACGLDPPLPLPAEADGPPPIRSDIEAFSSTRSGVKGFG